MKKKINEYGGVASVLSFYGRSKLKIYDRESKDGAVYDLSRGCRESG